MSNVGAYHLAVVFLASLLLLVAAHEFGRVVRRRSRLPAATLLPEPHASSVKALLQRYVDMRVDFARSPRAASDLEALLQGSDALHTALWHEAEQVAAVASEACPPASSSNR